MNKTEKLKEQIKNLQEKLEKEEMKSKLSLQEKIIGERVKDEIYFYTNYYKNITLCLDKFNDTDENLYNSFNYFKDKQEAEKFARFEYLNLKLIRLRNKLNNGWQPDWENSNEEKYFICFNSNKLENNFYWTYKVNNLYFKTQELRTKFLKLIPKNEILEYLNF